MAKKPRTTETMPGPHGSIVFTENHRPATPSGDFTVQVSQQIKADGRPPKPVLDDDGNVIPALPPPPAIDTHFPSEIRRFSVAGPRFTITSDVVATRFPPNGSLGNYHNVLPHLTFARSTLPWERFITPKGHKAGRKVKEIDTAMLRTPWLALVLFDQDEFPATGGDPDTDKSTRISASVQCKLVQKAQPKTQNHKSRRQPNWTLEPKAPNGTLAPAFTHEFSQQSGDPVSTIDIPRALLQAILPNPDEVRILGHASHSTDASGVPFEDTTATLICNRLPRSERQSEVHLISLEGLYGLTETSIWDIPSDVETVRVVTLANWRFTCLDARHDFKGLLHHLNKEHLFSIDVEPADARDPTKLSKPLRAAFKAHDFGVSTKARLRLDAPAWNIHDLTHHLRLRVRFTGEALRVYANQRPVTEIPADTRDPETGAIGAATLADLRTACASLSPAIDLSPDAYAEFLAPDKWRLSDPDGPDYWIHKTARGLDVHRALPHTLRLPVEDLSHARARVQQGHVALPHALRQGNSSISWYRGPLVPGSVAAPLDEDGKPPSAPLSADSLLRFDPRDGMLSTGYAAAWQMGRLLMLQNQKVAISLLDWKRQHRQASERARVTTMLEHLPIEGQDHPKPDDLSAKLPADVSKWFADLGLLKGLPFNYLVPDENMLPAESLRFFQVDPAWVRALQDGAFSVGRVSPLDHARDQGHSVHRAALPKGIMSGILLRSELVSGWPHLAMNGYDSAIEHEDYEPALAVPKLPVPARLREDTAFRDALNRSDATVVADRLNLPANAEIDIFTTIPNRVWAVNVNRNEFIYRVETAPDGFIIAARNELALLRMARLSPNTLLCLFAGEIKTLDIHQKPGALHFGFSHEKGNGPDGVRYYRELKSHLGTELAHCKVDTPFREAVDGNGARTVNLLTPSATKNSKATGLNPAMSVCFGKIPKSTLQTLATHSFGEDAGAIARFKDGIRRISEHQIGSDQMALQLTEGVAKVRFVLGET